MSTDSTQESSRRSTFRMVPDNQLSLTGDDGKVIEFVIPSATQLEVYISSGPLAEVSVELGIESLETIEQWLTDWRHRLEKMTLNKEN